MGSVHRSSAVFVLSVQGTLVVAGRAHGIVVATGSSTAMGSIRCAVLTGMLAPRHSSWPGSAFIFLRDRGRKQTIQRQGSRLYVGS